jgi:hypothetical protein
LNWKIVAHQYYRAEKLVALAGWHRLCKQVKRLTEDKLACLGFCGFSRKREMFAHEFAEQTRYSVEMIPVTDVIVRTDRKQVRRYVAYRVAVFRDAAFG